MTYTTTAAGCDRPPSPTDTSWNMTMAPCDLCEEPYYEPRITDAVVRLLEQTDVAPGRAIAVDYAPADAA